MSDAGGSGALLIAAVCEAAADQRTVSILIDRLLVEQVEWLDADSLAATRSYRGIEAHNCFVAWRHVRRLAGDAFGRRFHPNVHGHFGGEPGAADADAARRAIQLVRQIDPDVILLVRDADNQPERRRGLEQARSTSPLEKRIVIGVADPMRECWVLAAFEPQTDGERTLLEDEKCSLGFDPCVKSTQLRDRNDGAPRSAKRVLKALLDDGAEAEEWVLRQAGQGLMRERGRENGLAAFLGEVEARICPLLGGGPR